MSLKMKNLIIGVNENGFHFRDSETGLIFTLIEADMGRLDIAICSESSNENLKKEIKKILRDNGLDVPKEFSNITRDKCYFSENSDLFWVDGFAGDGIGIRHKKTKRLLNLEKVANGVSVIGLCSDSYYGYEEVVSDFFRLCSDNSMLIQTNTPIILVRWNLTV